MTKYISNGVEFKVGDKVRIEREIVSSAPNGMGDGVKWDNSWVGSMTRSIGKEVTISRISGSGACFEEIGMGYPLAALTNLSTPATRKHGIKAGSKVRVLNAGGCYDYRPYVGKVLTVAEVEVHGCDGCMDIIRCEGIRGGQWPDRFELVKELPRQFRVRGTDSYPNTYDVDLDKETMTHIKDDGSVGYAYGGYPESKVQGMIDKGEYVVVEAPTSLVLIGPSSNNLYDVDFVARTRISRKTGAVWDRSVTRAKIDKLIAEGWKVASAKDIAAADAAKAAKEAAEAKAKAVAEAESKVADAQAALITAINELAALKA